MSSRGLGLSGATGTNCGAGAAEAIGSESGTAGAGIAGLIGVAGFCGAGFCGAGLGVAPGIAGALSPPRQALGLGLSEPPIPELEVLPEFEEFEVGVGAAAGLAGSSARPMSIGWAAAGFGVETLGDFGPGDGAELG